MLSFSLQALCLNTLLTGRAVFPTGLRTLVATDMEVLTWEERNNLTKNVIQEAEHIFLARTHHDILYTPNSSQRPLLTFA